MKTKKQLREKIKELSETIMTLTKQLAGYKECLEKELKVLEKESGDE